MRRAQLPSGAEHASGSGSMSWLGSDVPAARRRRHAAQQHPVADGRDRYSGRRTMLRVLGDPLLSTGIMPGFPSPVLATGTRTPRAA